MIGSRRGVRVLLSLAVCLALHSACGKKGPPLPPLARVPAAPGNAQVARVGDEVYIWFTVPSANVSGQTPADVSAIDLYAVTSIRPPAGEDLTEQAAKVATYPVLPPLPPAPPPADGQSPPPAPPLPGFAQGATAVVRETLSAEARQLAAPLDPAIEVDVDEVEFVEPVGGPLVAPSDLELPKRYYFLVAVSPRGRESAPTAVLSVPLGDTSQPPTNLQLDYTESSMTLSWDSGADARRGPASADPALLQARPVVAAGAPTGYHVFEWQPGGDRGADPFTLSLPTPLTSQPLAATEFTITGPVRFGAARCFVVRPVDLVAGVVTVGRASEPECVTPVDTFPPAPPSRLAAIAGVGVINLIWEANGEPDLRGYIVLRGTAPGDTLQALTASPIRETTYRDQSVEAGVRYVYAVVAVDTATPQNVSGQSNRVEESSRTP